MIKLPLNADTIVGMTETEATEWIKSHDSDLQLFIISKDGIKTHAVVYPNAIYVIIENDFITSYIIT